MNMLRHRKKDLKYFTGEKDVEESFCWIAVRNGEINAKANSLEVIKRRADSYSLIGKVF